MCFSKINRSEVPSKALTVSIDRQVYELRADLEKRDQGANTLHGCVVLWPNVTGPAFSTVNFDPRNTCAHIGDIPRETTLAPTREHSTGRCWKSSRISTLGSSNVACARRARPAGFARATGPGHLSAYPPLASLPSPGRGWVSAPSRGGPLWARRAGNI